MSAQELVLKTRSEHESRVRWGRNLAESAVSEIPGRVLAVADENFAKCHGDFMKNLSARENVSVEILPSGEKYKTFATAIRLVERLAELRFTRSDAVLAIGGGVTTDLAGFVASLYMRGIVYRSIPTTLLAMVDASIGGKCGVDLPAGKNLAGSFYQPECVTADFDLLKTLPEAEIKNGLGEILKYGVISDETIFDLLDDFQGNLEEIVSRCIRIKCGVVASDEKESGGRMILNFGHTIGHAFEKLGGYEKYSHGMCVASGMIWESKFLEAAGLAKPSDTAFLERQVSRFGLGIEPAGGKWNAEQIIDCVLSDKKRRGGTLRFAGFSRIGEGKVFSFPMEQAADIMRKIF